MRVVANLNLLARVANFTSTDSTRFYLQGVAVDCTRAVPVLAATDGHVLGVWRDPGASVAGELHRDGPPIVTAATIVEAFKGATKAAKAGRDSGTLWLVIEGDAKAATARVLAGVTFDHKDAAQVWRAPQDHGRLIDGIFPDWRRVLPNVMAETPPHERATDAAPIFNGDQLARFTAAIRGPGVKALSASGAWLQVTVGDPSAPATVTASSHPDFLGVIMPATRNVGTPLTRAQVADFVKSFNAAPLAVREEAA